MSTSKKAIYPGTFDPITHGHADIISRASKIVDELIIGVSTSFSKNPMFTSNERCKLIEIYIKKYNIAGNVKVLPFDGLLVDFAQKIM
jgi:pantetheine-phosphate adenylyltransferase